MTVADRGYRLRDVGSLPPTLDGHQVADLFGCSYWGLLDLVKSGSCPVEPLRLGRKLRWPTAEVLRVLGVEMGEPGPLNPGSAAADQTPAAEPIHGQP